MSDNVITINNLSKAYRIDSYSDNGNSVWNNMFLPFARLKKIRNLTKIKGSENDTDVIWALKDIEFNVKQGEMVGLVGSNGAGKSTLLKILSRITNPTTGEIVISGNVASLLEVGTGFNQELTGRENVMLNAMLLGMRKEDVWKRFDEIVWYSGVEKYIDTPVKRYSSGMIVRLAFSVAAHLDSDILFVDEVLAVGDSAFQSKSIKKMREIVSGQGKTIIFVSHNISTVLSLCKRGILLDKGHMVSDNDISAVYNQYLKKYFSNLGFRKYNDIESAPGDDAVRLEEIKIQQNNTNVENLDIRHPFDINISYKIFRNNLKVICLLKFVNELGQVVFESADILNDYWNNKKRDKGLYQSTCKIPGNFLAEGMFSLHLILLSYYPDTVFHVDEQNIVTFQVIDNGEPGSIRYVWPGNIQGYIRPMIDWDVEFNGKEV